MKRSTRAFELGLVKLLNRVRVQNDWSAESFKEAAKHIVDVTSAEGARFQKAMLEFNYITKSGDHRKYAPNFDVKVWKNDDLMISMIRDILECAPDVMKTRGRKAGISPFRKEVSTEESAETSYEEVVEIQQEDIESDPCFGVSLEDAIKLVKEIAKRGGLTAYITLS